MNWLKLSSDFDHHPQVLGAGWHGSQLFLLFLRLSRRFRLNGLIPPKYHAREYVLRFWGAPADFPYETAKRAIVSSGLAHEGSDGTLLIDGWERWAPKEEVSASTERVRRFRKKKRNETDETKRNVGNDRGEEKRREEKRREERLLSTSVDPPAPEDRLVDLWNSTATPELPRCNRLTDERRKKAKRLLEAVPLDEWPKLIANANASDFCRGIGSDWKLSLSWMLKSPENALKVLEGNYANKSKAVVDVRRGHVRAEDMDFSNVPIGRINP